MVRPQSQALPLNCSLVALVLGFVHNCAQNCAVDLPVHRREHVTYNIRFHFFAAVLPQRTHIEHYLNFTSPFSTFW